MILERASKWGVEIQSIVFSLSVCLIVLMVRLRDRLKLVGLDWLRGVDKGRYCEEPYTFGKSGVSLIFELPFLLLLTIYE